MADDKFEEIDISDFDDFEPVDVSDFDESIEVKPQPSEQMSPVASTAIGAATGGALGTAGMKGTQLADDLMSDRLTQAAIGMDTTPTGTKLKGEAFQEAVSDLPQTGAFTKAELVQTGKELPLTDTVSRGKEVSNQLSDISKQKSDILKQVSVDDIKSKELLDAIRTEIGSSTQVGTVQREAALKEYKKIAKELAEESFDPVALEKVKDSIKFENITLAEKPGASEGRNLARQAQRRILKESVEDTVKEKAPNLFDQYMDLKSKQGQLGNIMEMAEESYKGRGSKIAPISGAKELINKYYEKAAGMGVRGLQGAAKVGKALPVVGTAIGAAIGASQADAGEGLEGAMSGAAESLIPLGLTPSDAGPVKGTPEYDLESGKGYKQYKAKLEPIENTNEVEKSVNLENKSNLSDLIQRFEELKEKNPNYENYVNKLKTIEDTGSEMDKTQMEFNLLQQPAFRQYMKGKDVKK